MAFTYEELKKKTVAELRDIAKEVSHDSVQGYTQLNKDHLLVALCKAFSLDMHEHHHVIGLNKTEIKSQIRVLKGKRDQAAAAHDSAQLKQIRRRIHHLNRLIHKATV
jgi:hypothetical protein